MSEFPQWGFWISKLRGERYREGYNTTNRRHLFLTENKTACGYTPKKSIVMRFSFSDVPKIDGIWEVLSEMKRGRLFTAEDFPKCKRCLKHRLKEGES